MPYRRSPYSKSLVSMEMAANCCSGPALIQPGDLGETQQGQPETPKKNPVSAQKSSPRRGEVTPKHGWCPECTYGYKVLGKVNPDGGHPNAGHRRFSCSNRTRGCKFFEIIPGDAIIEAANTTPVRAGNCPQCRVGNLMEKTQSPWDYRDRSLVCDRNKAKERPCNYEKKLPKVKYTPKLVGNVRQPDKGHSVLGPAPSPIGKSPLGKSSAVGRAPRSRRSSPVQMTRPLRAPDPVVDSTPTPSPSPSPTPSYDEMEMDTEEVIRPEESPKAHKPLCGDQASANIKSAGVQKMPQTPAQRDSETDVFGFLSPSRVTARRDPADADVFGRPATTKPIAHVQAKNSAASTSQWLRRGSLTSPWQGQKPTATLQARPAVATIADPSDDVIDHTRHNAPFQTPHRAQKTFYPTPDTNVKTKGKTNAPTVRERQASEEFDFGLDENDLLEFAEQVDKSVPARARSESTDYGSFDEDEIEDLIRITDEAAAQSPSTPAGKKLPASAAQLWTPSKTPTHAPARNAAAGATPITSTRSTTVKTRAPAASARTQFQKPPPFKANKTGRTVVEID
ncbi:hypothetical protein QBC34DRAFT_395317, partial [Podospora aff. communis PSN243]